MYRRCGCQGCGGKRPCYSFFYPGEEYRPELLAPTVQGVPAATGAEAR
jgi:hypothetical protein